MPNNSNVTNQGNTINIAGGTRAGRNLFHSFNEFSIPTNGVAYFNNSLAIQNIISRVTGGSVSNIDGVIRANGAANLFLINPSGIIFGRNASLNIGGSFVGSTASSLKFADGKEFSTRAPETAPLLTIAVPVGLQFGANPGKILVQGDGQGIRQTSDLIDTTAGLHVAQNQTLALVGSDVTLEGGTLKTAGGRIELGSVADSSLVSLTPIDKGWSLGYADVHNFRDIHLYQQAAVDASGVGGGDIQVQGRQVLVTGGSRIEASTLGSKNGGTVVVNGLESVQVSGEGVNGLISAFLAQVYTDATGAGGDLRITTEKLIVRDGAQIVTATLSSGNAGKVDVNASKSVEVSGISAKDSETNSELLTSALPGATGAGGDLRITTEKLIVRDGAQIVTATLSSGNAGKVDVNASKSVELSGISAKDSDINSGLFTSALPGATGAAGDLRITTEKLIVRDGAEVVTSTFGPGNAGKVDVNASKSVELSGTSVNGKLASGLFSTTQPGATGAAGDLTIITTNFKANDGAKASSSTSSQGKGGDIQVKSTDFRLASGAILSTATRSGGDGGNITVNTNNLELDSGGQILATTSSSKSAGTINVIVLKNATIFGSDPNYTARLARSGPTIVVNEGASSGIFANTTPASTGKGGSIFLYPTNFKLSDGGTISVGSLGKGDAGNLNIQSSTVNIDNRSSLFATTANSEGGNIKLQANNLFLLRGGSKISATAGTAKAGGDGGNITIKTPFIVAVPSENSDISANAYTGKGGNINITAQGIFGIQPRTQDTPLSDITASSQFGISGTVQINILNPTTVQEVQILPTSTVDPTKLIAPACRANVGPHANSFIITGSGGLPPNPSDTKGGDSVIEELATGIPDHSGNKYASAITSSSKSDEPDEIVEATGVATNAKGEVVAFVANAPSYTPDIPWLRPASCQTH